MRKDLKRNRGGEGHISYICIFIDVCTYIDIHTSMIDMYTETMGVNFQNWFKGILQETRIFEGTVY
jgi:hypothetical protein